MTTLSAVQGNLLGFSLKFTKLSTYFKRTRTINKLNALSDRHLKDIGIERSQIKAIVYKKVI